MEDNIPLIFNLHFLTYIKPTQIIDLHFLINYYNFSKNPTPPIHKHFSNNIEIWYIKYFFPYKTITECNPDMSHLIPDVVNIKSQLC